MCELGSIRSIRMVCFFLTVFMDIILDIVDKWIVFFPYYVFLCFFSTNKVSQLCDCLFLMCFDRRLNVSFGGYECGFYLVNIRSLGSVFFPVLFSVFLYFLTKLIYDLVVVCFCVLTGYWIMCGLGLLCVWFSWFLLLNAYLPYCVRPRTYLTIPNHSYPSLNFPGHTHTHLLHLSTYPSTFFDCCSIPTQPYTPYTPSTPISKHNYIRIHNSYL